MIKLLTMLVCVSFCVSSVNASLNSNQIAALRGGLKSQIVVNGVTYVWNSETGQPVVKGSVVAGPIVKGSVVAGKAGNAGVTTGEQMKTAVAQDLPGSMAAVQKAQSNIGVEPSNTPNQTVYNYIMGL